jgi:hypothetical protein
MKLWRGKIQIMVVEPKIYADKREMWNIQISKCEAWLHDWYPPLGPPL